MEINIFFGLVAIVAFVYLVANAGQRKEKTEIKEGAKPAFLAKKEEAEIKEGAERAFMAILDKYAGSGEDSEKILTLAHLARISYVREHARNPEKFNEWMFTPLARLHSDPPPEDDYGDEPYGSSSRYRDGEIIVDSNGRWYTINNGQAMPSDEHGNITGYGGVPTSSLGFGTMTKDEAGEMLYHYSRRRHRK